MNVCPVDCIYETERMHLIDPDECIDCGACEAECPVEAIFPGDGLPEEWTHFERINASWRDESAVKKLIAEAGIADAAGS